MGFISKLFGTDGAYKSAIDTYQNDKSEARGLYGTQMYMPMGADSANQAVMSYGRKTLADQLNQAKQTGDLMGTSTAALKAQQEAASNSIANLGAQLGQNTTANRNAAMQGYLNATQSYDKAINDTKVAQAQAESQALTDMIKSAAGVASTALKG